jgi:50S ribosomal subunit-associated GTPase HflX
MALSKRATEIMDELSEAYRAQGYPPISDWWIQLRQADASILVGEGMIELVAEQQWALTEPGHQYCMSRR